MKRIYSFESYKDYVLARLASSPKKGRGQFSRMAKAAKTYSSSLSQVFRGDKHLTNDQAAAICEFFELTDQEAEYFLLLLQSARAGTKQLKRIVDRRLQVIRNEESRLDRRLTTDHKMDENGAAIFYSNWIYSAVRMLTFIEPYQSVETIANRLKLPRATILEVVQFLLKHRLCVERNGKIVPGPKHTHLGATSPLASRHHANWRIKALEKHPTLSSISELAYTAPIALSKIDADKVREICASAIEEIRKLVDQSPSQALYCLNLDWFEVAS